jgi:hypothetical protein
MRGFSDPALALELRRAWHPDQLEFRVADGGAVLAHVSARAAAQRLTEALGVGGWGWAVRTQRTPGEHTHAAHGTLTLHLGEQQVAVEDFGAGHSAKSASSDALLRAASLVGVGSVLYAWRPSRVRPGELWRGRLTSEAVARRRAEYVRYLGSGGGSMHYPLPRGFDYLELEAPTRWELAQATRDALEAGVERDTLAEAWAEAGVDQQHHGSAGSRVQLAERIGELVAALPGEARADEQLGAAIGTPEL